MTADGRRTRRGQLFRSDTLQALTSADTAYLTESLGVTTVLDLRASAEAVEQGRGPLGGLPVCYLNVPLEDAPCPAGKAGPSDQPDPAPGQPAGLGTRAYSRLLPAPTWIGRPGAAAGRADTGRVAGSPGRGALRCGQGPHGADRRAGPGPRRGPGEAIAGDYMVTAQNMARINERFRGWPRYREHMAAADPEVYRWKSTRSGRSWLRCGGVTAAPAAGPAPVGMPDGRPLLTGGLDRELTPGRPCSPQRPRRGRLAGAPGTPAGLRAIPLRTRPETKLVQPGQQPLGYRAGQAAGPPDRRGCPGPAPPLRPAGWSTDGSIATRGSADSMPRRR